MKRWKVGVFSTAVLVVWWVLTATAQLPARDAQPARPINATATVRGRVIAAATGQPLHRVRITLNGNTPNPPSSVTDLLGNFEITGVPAGSYVVSAVRAGYLTIQYGQRRPRESGRTITIKDDEIREHIDIGLFKGAVLSGRVVDDLGEAYPGVRVEAMEIRYTRGQRVPVQVAVATTTDTGAYRISGLDPGTYFVRASASETWRGDDEKNEIFSYAQTYYPGVAGVDRAQRVTLAVGQEASNLDFPMIGTAAGRLRGVLLTRAANRWPVNV